MLWIWGKGMKENKTELTKYTIKKTKKACANELEEMISNYDDYVPINNELDNLIP